MDRPARLEEAISLLKPKARSGAFFPRESASVAVMAADAPQTCWFRCFTAQSWQSDWETVFVFPDSI